MLASLRTGGHEHASTTAVADLLELAMADATAAAMLSLSLRGDRTISDPLRARLAALKRVTRRGRARPAVGRRAPA